MQTLFLTAAAIWAWCIILFGWPGNPFEFMPHAQDAAPSIPKNEDLAIILRHFEKIFGYWAQHDNIVVLAGVVVVFIIAWMAIKLTEQHAQNPRQIHNHYYGEGWHGHELDSQVTPPKQLEPPRGNKLPVVMNQRQR